MAQNAWFLSPSEGLRCVSANGEDILPWQACVDPRSIPAQKRGSRVPRAVIGLALLTSFAINAFTLATIWQVRQETAAIARHGDQLTRFAWATAVQKQEAPGYRPEFAR